MSVPNHAGNQDSSQGQDGQQAPNRETLGEGHIMGNLTHDPELHFTGSGRAVASLRVAFVQRVLNQQANQWQDSDPVFYDVQAWGDQGTRAAENLRRGDRIVAAGHWVREHYVSREGQPKSRTRLVARDLGASMLFRAVYVDRSNGQRRGSGPAVPMSMARPEGQSAAPQPPAEDPWEGTDAAPAGASAGAGDE